MPAVELVSELSAGDADILSIENNANIAIIAVRTISRLIFGLKDGRYLRSKSTENLEEFVCFKDIIEQQREEKEKEKKGTYLAFGIKNTPTKTVEIDTFDTCHSFLARKYIYVRTNSNIKEGMRVSKIIFMISKIH